MKIHPVTVRIDLIGLGKRVELEHRTLQLQEQYLDPDIFVEKFLRQDIIYQNKPYRYLDCLSESFFLGNEHRVIYHVRYCLDAEKENFSFFLDNLKISDIKSEQK